MGARGALIMREGARRMALNKRNEVFCEEYCADHNGARAYQAAGYQVKNADVAASAAARLLKRADIRERIAQLEQDALNRAGVTADWLVGRLRDVTERSMAAVPVMEWSAAERKLVETGEYRFDSAGANKALETLAKMRGMLTERRDMSVDADVRMVLDGELREFAE